MENLITLRQREVEFFGGMDYAARRAAVEAAHQEALELNEQHNDWQPEVELTNEQLHASMTREKDPKAAHAEALKIKAAYDAQIAFECKTKPFQQKMVEWAHAEALEMDKQATHFRKEQAALSQRAAIIMGKAPA